MGTVAQSMAKDGVKYSTLSVLNSLQNRFVLRSALWLSQPGSSQHGQVFGGTPEFE
jgi:hypothetical protein